MRSRNRVEPDWYTPDPRQMFPTGGMSKISAKVTVTRHGDSHMHRSIPQSRAAKRNTRVRRVQTLEPVDTVVLQRVSTIATSINRWFTGSARRPQQAANASIRVLLCAEEKTA